MQIQMNIEVPPGRERDLAAAVRSHFGKWPQVQPFVASYEGPDGPETQTVQVLSVDAPRASQTTSHVVGLAYLLSVEFEQDCVAVYFPETHHGMLVGPNAVKWGDFDPAFFHQPLPAADEVPQEFADSLTSALQGE